VAYGTFLALMAYTAPLASLPDIAADLGAGVSASSWIVASISVGLAVALVPAGALGDDVCPVLMALVQASSSWRVTYVVLAGLAAALALAAPALLAESTVGAFATGTGVIAITSYTPTLLQRGYGRGVLFSAVVLLAWSGPSALSALGVRACWVCAASSVAGAVAVAALRPAAAPA
jgi:MFS family permease